MPKAAKAGKTQAPAAQTALADLVRRAQNGDESALPALRRELAENGRLVQAVGDLALQVQETLAGQMGGDNLLFREALSQKLDNMRREVAGPNPSPVERLLADRVALCWLAVHESELRYAQAKDLSLRQAAHWQARIDAGHRRYLSAIRTLATVRRLALPAVQVNVARRQVNVLATGGAVQSPPSPADHPTPAPAGGVK